MDKGLLSTLYSFFDLPLIADIASLIGLTLTIFVLFGIRIIQRNFLFRARVPDFLGKIREHASSISTGLNTYPDSKDAIDEVLSLAEVDIDDLCRKSRNPLKKKSNHYVEIFGNFVNLLPINLNQI